MHPARVLVFAALLATPPARAADAATTRDIVYARPAGEALALDLAVPAGAGPFPLVVCVHGGGWKAGKRQDLGPLTETLAQAGFAAATVSYRFAPKHQFPAQINDCKAAVRFLRAEAARYRIDPARVGAVGFSAGGHLVSLLGVADANDGLEGDEGHPEQSSRVQAVVNFFGPTDLTLDDVHTDFHEKTFLIGFLGGRYADKADAYKRASPVTYATKDDAPHLFLHGTKDTLVSPKQSHRLADALERAGVPAEVVEYAGAGHGWAGDQLKDSTRRTIAFFDKHLKPKPPAAVREQPAPPAGDGPKPAPPAPLPRKQEGDVGGKNPLALADVTVERGVKYGTGGGRDLLLDLARPAQAEGRRPAVVCVHGGAWVVGHRSRLSTTNYLFPKRPLIEQLAAAGFVAATVDYRLVPAGRFPAPVEDCKAAVRWLRANADRLGIDPNRVGAVGYSAGGHLACMLGVTDKTDGLEGEGGHPDQSSRVQAVVSLYGPTDLTNGGVRDDARERLFVVPFLGVPFEGHLDQYKRASPVCYADRGDPPFLFLHGAKDRVVEPKHSRALAEVLRKAGVPARVVEYEKLGHAFGGEANERATREAVEFLTATLGGRS